MWQDVKKLKAYQLLLFIHSIFQLIQHLTEAQTLILLLVLTRFCHFDQQKSIISLSSTFQLTTLLSLPVCLLYFSTHPPPPILQLCCYSLPSSHLFRSHHLPLPLNHHLQLPFFVPLALSLFLSFS